MTSMEIQCPRCRAQGPFHATIVADAYLDAQGIAINQARLVANRTAQCATCHHRGDLADFSANQQNHIKIRTVGDNEDDHVHTGPGFARARSWIAEETSAVDALIDQYVEQQLALDDTFKDIAHEYRNDPEIRAWVESVLFRRMIRAAVRPGNSMPTETPRSPRNGVAKRA